MDESHSNSTKHKPNNFSSKNILLSRDIIDYQNIKVDQVHPIPIYIYDAPNDLGLSILQAIFQIAVNPFHSSHIYSAYILPDNLNRIFFEASDLKSVRRTLHYISGIRSVPKNLPVVRGEQINQFFVNPVGCLHFHPGQIVTLHNPEFDNQLGQIVDIKKESGKILIKTYPHIDYDFLRRHKKFATQTQVNESMGPDYKAPMVPFNKEGLATTNSLIPIWNSQVNGIKWDNKFFIGKFQYVWINYKEIAHKNLEELSEDEKRCFLEGISDYEKMNPSFIKGFNGQLNFEGTHSSDSILQLSLNKGMPTWAHKKAQRKNLLSDSSSDSDLSLDNNPKNYSKSQNPEIRHKNASKLSNQNQNIQFSQNRNIVSNEISDEIDIPPSFPDFDDDDDNEMKEDLNQNKKNQKNNKSPIFIDSTSSTEINQNKNFRKNINSPIFIDSSSTESENDDHKSNSKRKNDNSNSKSKHNKSNSKTKADIDLNSIFTSSDSDIDSLFNTNTSKKSNNNKKTSSKKNQKQKHQNEKTKTSNNKPNNEKQSNKSKQSKSQNQSLNQSSQIEREKNTKQKNKNKPIKNLLDSSSNSSDSDIGAISHSQTKKSPRKKIKNLLDSSSESSSDVEIIYPEREKKNKQLEIKKKKEKEGQKKMIKDLFKESVDYGDSPPSEKTYFGYASDSDSDNDQEVEFEPTLDRASILEEQSQQISKRKMRKYYKRKGLPVPDKYLSDSYSVDSDSSSS